MALTDEMQRLKASAEVDQASMALGNVVRILATIRSEAIASGFSKAEAFELARTYFAEFMRTSFQQQKGGNEWRISRESAATPGSSICR